jgi:hypothetical protein
MANPVRKPIDIVAQLDAIAAKDPVSQLSIKRRAAVQPDASWLTNSSPLAPGVVHPTCLRNWMPILT